MKPVTPSSCFQQFLQSSSSGPSSATGSRGSLSLTALSLWPQPLPDCARLFRCYWWFLYMWIQFHLLFLSLVCCKQSAFSILSWLSDISHLHVFSLQPSHFVCAYWQFHTQLTGNKQYHYHTFDFLPIGTVYHLSCCSSASFQSAKFKSFYGMKTLFTLLHVTAVESFLLTQLSSCFW